jgi:heat shock protein HslJ
MRRLEMIMALAMLGACTPAHPAATPAPSSRSVAGSAWTIATVNGAPSQAARPTAIRFSADRITGNAGCNSFGGRYTQAGDVLTVDQIVSTKMACIGDGMAQEQAVFSILAAPVMITWAADGGLTLRDVAGTMTLAPSK